MIGAIGMMMTKYNVFDETTLQTENNNETVQPIWTHIIGNCKKENYDKIKEITLDINNKYDRMIRGYVVIDDQSIIDNNIIITDILTLLESRLNIIIYLCIDKAYTNKIIEDVYSLSCDGADIDEYESFDIYYYIRDNEKNECNILLEKLELYFRYVDENNSKLKIINELEKEKIKYKELLKQMENKIFIQTYN